MTRTASAACCLTTSEKRPPMPARRAVRREQPELLTINEAAALLRVHPRTVRRFIEDGRLPGYQLGGRVVRVRRDDLTKLLTRIPTAG
ncbi:helix-turn-helix domain-containing protein [Mycolicibacterium austroafricanum]|nr:helix-turn-helix domain-containing protein [Mycolicibacterium austroafricanum]